MRLLASRKRFKVLLFRIRNGLFNDNKIQLSNYGLTDVDINLLLEAIARSPRVQNRIFEIDIGNRENVGIEANRNEFSVLCISNLKNLAILKVNNTGLKELRLNGLTRLSMLIANNNELGKLTLADTPGLNFLDLNHNQFSEFSARSIPSLQTLWLASNHLKILDVSDMSQLKELVVDNNPLETLIFHGAPLWSRLQYSSELFDKVTRLLINAKKEYSAATITDSYHTNVDQAPINLNLQDLEKYFAIVEGNFKKYSASHFLTIAANSNMWFWVAIGLGPQYWSNKLSMAQADAKNLLASLLGCAKLPAEFAIEFAIDEFKGMVTRSFHKVYSDLVGYIDPVGKSANQSAVLEFQQQHFSRLLNQLCATGRKKLVNNQALQTAIQVRVRELNPAPAENMAISISKQPTVLFGATSLLKSSISRNTYSLLSQAKASVIRSKKSKPQEEATHLVVNRVKRKGWLSTIQIA